MVEMDTLAQPPSESKPFQVLLTLEQPVALTSTCPVGKKGPLLTLHSSQAILASWVVLKKKKKKYSAAPLTHYLG